MSEPHDGADQSVSEDTSVADLVADAGSEQDGDTLGDGAPAEASDGEGDKPKPKPTAQERFDELTRLRRDAEREAEFWKAKATQGAQPEKPKAEPVAEDKEPDPADYEYGETDAQFVKDTARFHGRQAYREEAAKERRATQVRTVEQTWTERQQTFAKDKPDYDQVVHDHLPISPPMAEAIKTSELGPEIAYHLGKNPDEARRIAGLNPLAAIREIGRLEARLDTKAAPPKPASDAPPPPPQVRGQGGRYAVAADTDDFEAFQRAHGVKAG